MAITKFTHSTNVGSEVTFPANKQFKINVADLSVACLMGKFGWGPINTPTEIFNESELKEIFVSGNENWKQLLILFRKYKPNKVVINRLAHYTNLTDKSTITAVKSSFMLTDNEVVPKDVLKVEGRYFGAYGDNIKVTTLRTNKITTTTTASLATGGTFVPLTSVDQIEVGEILFIDDSTTSVYVKVTKIDGLIVYFAAVTLGLTITTGADVVSKNFNLTIYNGTEFIQEYENLSLEVENVIDYIGNAIPRDSNHLYNVFVQTLTTVPLEERTPKNYTLQALASGSDGSPIVAADYIGNSVTKLGVYAIDRFKDGAEPVTFCIPEMIDATVHNAFKDYVDANPIHFFLGDFAFGSTQTQAITFVKTTAKINSERIAYHFPNLIYEDPETPGQYITVKSSVSVVGRWSLTDKVTNAGPWQPSAGEQFGELAGVYGLETVLEAQEQVVLTDNPDIRDELRKEKINPIFTKDGAFFIESVFLRETRKNPEYIHISQVRLAQYVGASLDLSLGWVEMQNHTTTLEDKVRIISTDFVDKLPNEALEGNSPAERREIICGPANNPRNPITGKIENPEDFRLSCYLSILSPVQRTHIEIYKKIN